MSRACATCLHRAALLALLAGRIEIARRRRRGLRDVLALDDEALLRAVGGVEADGLRACAAAIDPGELASSATAAGLTALCRHDRAYPSRLRDDRAAPATLFVAGRLERFTELVGEAEGPPPPVVAVVGTRKASAEGVEIARVLGRGLAAAGVTVVSGLALGIDGAAHDGALEAGGATVAVLAGGADIPYPQRRRRTHEELARRGAVVSEMPAGFRAFPWSFLARNRIIAGLAAATIVVEAAERSGSLVTAELTLELGRDVGAVPGSVLSWRSRGANALLRDGATLVRDARDALDLALGFDPDARAAAGARAAGPVPAPAGLEPELAALLNAIEAGEETLEGLVGPAGSPSAVQAGLMELELLGLVRRTPGGRVARALGALRPHYDRSDMPEPIPVCLSIAGSDSGGGAGIQADLKAFARCGVHGTTAITALTAQNTVNVARVEPVSPAMIRAQVAAVAADLGVDAVKIGMVGGRPAIEAVAAALDALPSGTPVVLDPVMVAESGGRLLEAAAERALVELLLPRATVVTPNVPEARVLAGTAGGDSELPSDGAELAAAVRAAGVAAVVVTGGHREEATDLLLHGPGDGELVAIPGERHPDGAAHGSGCTHSSALAAHLALGASLPDAARAAREIAAEAVRLGLRELGRGAGPVNVLGVGRPAAQRA